MAKKVRLVLRDAQDMAQAQHIALQNNTEGLGYASDGHQRHLFEVLVEDQVRLYGLDQQVANGLIAVKFETYTGDYSPLYFLNWEDNQWYKAVYDQVDDEETPVIFRVYPDGEVIALFPTIPSSFINRYNVTAYTRVGQHGGADYNLVIRSTRRALPLEYAGLAEELQKRGYNVKVYARRTSAHRDEHTAAYAKSQTGG